MDSNGVGIPAPFICYSLIEYVGRLKKDGPRVTNTCESLVEHWKEKRCSQS